MCVCKTLITKAWFSLSETSQVLKSAGQAEPLGSRRRCHVIKVRIAREASKHELWQLAALWFQDRHQKMGEIWASTGRARRSKWSSGVSARQSRAFVCSKHVSSDEVCGPPQSVVFPLSWSFHSGRWLIKKQVLKNIYIFKVTTTYGNFMNHYMIRKYVVWLKRTKVSRCSSCHVEKENIDLDLMKTHLSFWSLDCFDVLSL